jgi:hypothetical protein
VSRSASRRYEDFFCFFSFEVSSFVSEVVLPFVPVVVPVALLSDWSPVVLVVELLRDWSPVVAVLLLLSDWSPVEVVFSIVRLERPRRSMFVGLTVEVEPVIEFCVLAVEPVTEDCDCAVEPLIDGLTVAVPLVVEDGAALVPAVVPLVVPAVRPLAAASLSGMQSWCTGLAECSFALPVCLSASLPACGWPSSEHSGLVAPLVVAVLVRFVVDDVAPLARFVPDVVAVLLVVGVALDALSETVALLVVCANAGVAPITAAAITLRVNGIRFITLSCQEKTHLQFLGQEGSRAGSRDGGKPARTDGLVARGPQGRERGYERGRVSAAATALAG